MISWYSVPDRVYCVCIERYVNFEDCEFCFYRDTMLCPDEQEEVLDDID